MEPILPRWAAQLRDRYLAGESSVFLLHGNVRDLVPWSDADGVVRYVTLREFLVRFLSRSKELVLSYSVAEGLAFAPPTPGKSDPRLGSPRDAFFRAINARRALGRKEPLLDLPQSAASVLDAVEDLVTDPTQRVGVVIDYIEAIVPNTDLAFMSEADKATLVRMLRLGTDPGLQASDNLVILVTETIGDVHRRLSASSSMVALEVPLPDQDDRSQFFRVQDRREIQMEVTEDQLLKVTAGLTLLQIRLLLREARQSQKPVTFASVNRRKKAIIEQECHGLVEFVDPAHDFSHVGGMEGVKAELMKIAESIRIGQRNRVPMGLIFVGPMGTGKTYLAEAFAKESGLTCLKFKNFREKWVGSTESNLERILQVVNGLGYVLLILDEADRSLGGAGDNDGGTSSRVIARLKEFMSDTTHRGRVVILMMTNRPDKLDTDLKRPGRFDVKVPFFFPEAPQERESVLRAVFRKLSLGLEPGVAFEHAVQKTAGYSAAELESVVLAAAGFASWDGREQVRQADLDRAVEDVIPSRDTRMLEFMEMLAVFEASSRRMLPERFASLTTTEVQARLDVLRLQLGARVAG